MASSVSIQMHRRDTSSPSAPTTSPLRRQLLLSIKVFKLLRLSKTCTPPVSIRYEILTITTPNFSCKWRTLDYGNCGIDYVIRPIFINNFGELTRSLCANGMLHWMCESNSCLIAFHLDNEKFDFAHAQTEHQQKVFKMSKLLQCGHVLGLLDVSSCSDQKLRIHSFLRFQTWPIWAKNTTILPADELCGDHPCDVTPVGTLPNGETLLANDTLNDCFTLVYSYNNGGERLQRFVVGKFPRSIASMSQMERASCITCLEEDITPPQVLLGNGYD